MRFLLYIFSLCLLHDCLDRVLADAASPARSVRLERSYRPNATKCPTLSYYSSGISVCLDHASKQTAGRMAPRNLAYRWIPVKKFDAPIFQIDDVYVNPFGIVYSESKVAFLNRNCAEDYYLASSDFSTFNATQMDSVAMLATKNDNSVFHFFVDMLPKFFQLISFLRASPDMQILVASMEWMWAVDVFFPEDALTKRMVPTRDNDKLVVAKKVLVPLSPICGEPIRSMIGTQLRQHFLNIVLPRVFEETAVPAPSLIAMVSYEIPAVLEHEAILEALLKQYCTDNVELFTGITQEAFTDQLQFLAKVSIFIGPHGVHNTAIMFLPTTATVVEFVPIRDVSLCYEFLAHACSLPYYVIKSKRLPPGSNTTALKIAVPEVMRTVKSIISANVKHPLRKLPKCGESPAPAAAAARNDDEPVPKKKRVVVEEEPEEAPKRKVVRESPPAEESSPSPAPAASRFTPRGRKPVKLFHDEPVGGGGGGGDDEAAPAAAPKKKRR